MHYLSLLIWVGQLGFSFLCPICFCLMIAHWLQTRYGLGIWIVITLGIFGFLCSIRVASDCIRLLQKQLDRTSQQAPPSSNFNEHF